MASLKIDNATKVTELQGTELIPVGTGNGQASVISTNDLLAFLSQSKGVNYLVVYLTVSSSDGLVDLNNKQIGVKIDDEPYVNYNLSAEGTVSFNVSIGSNYKITISDVSGYQPIPEKNYKATTDVCYITLTYSKGQTGGSSATEEILEMATRVLDTNATAIFNGLKATIETSSGETIESTFNQYGKSTARVKKGLDYTVKLPKIENYIAPADKLYTAALDYRFYYIPNYKFFDNNSGIFVTDNSGVDYTYQAYLDLSSKPQLVGLHCDLPELKSVLTGVDFTYYIPLDFITTGKSWAGSNVQFDSIPMSSNSTTAQSDAIEASTQIHWWDGPTMTERIIAEGDDRNITTLAADFCYYADGTGASKDRRSLQIGNKIAYGFLPSLKQMRILTEKTTYLQTINTILSELTGKTITLNSGTWWTSSLALAANSWYLGNGSPNYYNYFKALSYTVIPFYAFKR